MQFAPESPRCPCRRFWLLAAALTLAACGDSSSSNDDTKGPVTPATGDDPAPEWVTRITVYKHVEGGGYVASDFMMTVTVDGVEQSFPGSEAGTTVEVGPGTYSVSEQGPAGYEASYSTDCAGTIDDGETKTCVVTNTATDKCAGVVCVRWAPECGGQGTCNPETGECEFPDSPVGEPCTDDGNVCTDDVCNEEGYCVHPPGNEGTICREAAGVCDVAEVCTGRSVFCPEDGFLPDDTICREAPGICDAVEYCTGESADCPDDELLPAETVCRVAAGLCDVAEYCTGLRTDCPNDAYAPRGTVCREGVDDCDPDELCTGLSAACPADDFADCMVCGDKFYDADGNGTFDSTEAGLPDWIIELSDDGSPIYATTDAAGRYVFEGLVAGTYYVCELLPVETNWVQTAPPDDCYEIEVPLADAADCALDFGNMCVNGGGGHTPGFWSNKNGEERFLDDDGGAAALALLVGLNLRDGDGNHFDPASYAAFAAWLEARTAENMAYMLSAHLAAMALNVWTGFVDPYELIYAPGTTSANGDGIATIGDVLEEADAALAADGDTPTGDDNREYQEALKDALDGANNNSNYVDGSECYYNFPD